jgi:hypothetical protein
MISTDITGHVGDNASHLFSLLAVVADPDAYAAKLKALVDATEEHKKFVSLVSPASEVLRAREEISADKLTAKQDLAAARAEATKIKADANASAKVVLDKANKALAEAQEQAASILTDAQQQRDEANTILKGVKAQLAAATTAKKDATSRAGELEKMRLEVQAELDAAKADRDAIAAKLAAFAKGL